MNTIELRSGETRKVVEIIPIRDDNGDMYPERFTSEEDVKTLVEVTARENKFYAQLQGIYTALNFGGMWADYAHEEDYYIPVADKMYALVSSLLKELTSKNYTQILSVENDNKVNNLLSKLMTAINSSH